MGLQETDIFQDMNDSERFAAAIKSQKSLKEKVLSLIKELVGRNGTNQEDTTFNLFDDESL